MHKKHQIFISSTFADLKDERQAAVEAILAAGHIPAGMELFAAGDESQMEVIRRWIDDSDIYMLILGGRYGSVDPSSNISYTELEYDYAVQKGIPYFALVLNDHVIADKSKLTGIQYPEQNYSEEYKSFRSKVLSKISRLVDDCKDIKIGILESVRSLESKRALHGWIRSESVPELSPLIDQLTNLTSENSELKKQLKNIPIIEPDAAVALADLEDKINIEIKLRPSYRDSSYPTVFTLSWEEIFGLIAPKLLSGQSDSYMKTYIGSQIMAFNSRSCYEQHLKEHDFQTIKIQFIALRLIDVQYSSTTEGG
ncbi:MAG: DUF4062 domain-containing protein, partial [Methylotenera sp.]